MLIVLLIVAIFLGTIIYSWMEGKPDDSPSSKELLERIKCSDIKRIDFRIRGIAYLFDSEREIVFSLMPTDVLYLRREPWNPVDSNAVAVFRGGEKIGYVESPINNIILKYISSTFMYKCCFDHKEMNDKGYLEYYCAFFIEEKGSNDKLPIGVINPVKDNILTNPQIDFLLDKKYYDFYPIPGEWVIAECKSYGKESLTGIFDDPDAKELYQANYKLMSNFLKDLYLSSTGSADIKKYRGQTYKEKR